MATFYLDSQADPPRCLVGCPFIGCGAALMAKCHEDVGIIGFIGECNKCGHTFSLAIAKGPEDDYVDLEEDLT
jgi:hypothetical protein